jgi:hypothetical protein
MKDGNKVEAKLHAFLTPVLDVLHSSSFIPGNKAPVTIWQKAIGFRAGLDMASKKNIPALPEIKFWRPTCGQSLYWLSYSGL